MSPLFVAVMTAEVQAGLFVLCLVIAFATPTGRRNIVPTVFLFGGCALGGFLGLIAWYGTALAAVLITAAGATALGALSAGWIALGTLCLAYLFGTLLGGRVGWQLAQRGRPDAPRIGPSALRGNEAQ